MQAALDPRSPKRHVNLSLREDLYKLAQDSAREAGLSLSGLVERWLLSIALRADLPGKPQGDKDLEELRGILKDGTESLSKQEARALRHEARIRKGRP